ncbi:hypothetical protein ONK27_26530, partial [Salmonella enterica subsp. enterica serovar Virginia]|nr:hypothetical protein [Salmonella enterica subsp. enterica serovar Virginia]
FTYQKKFGIILPVQIMVVIPQRIRWPKKTILKCKVPFSKRYLSVVTQRDIALSGNLFAIQRNIKM